MNATPPEVLRMKRRGGAEEPGLWPAAGALSRPQRLPERFVKHKFKVFRLEGSPVTTPLLEM
ncbi:MAG: hypothetical protein FRX49_10498 [Trebouxia sp. A1-2]|nr:MAG: hypothetical protein FRX49_10498 [Trebouxia sp. A1-2]